MSANAVVLFDFMPNSELKEDKELRESKTSMENIFQDLLSLQTNFKSGVMNGILHLNLDSFNSYLSENHTHTHQITDVLKMLAQPKMFKELQTLNLSNNNFGSTKTLLLKKKKHSTQCERVMIQDSNLPKMHGKLITKILSFNSGLMTLVLAKNQLGTGGHALCQKLNQCPQLTHLDLRENNLSPQSLQVLQKSVKKLSKLQALYLQGNGWYYDGNGYGFRFKQKFGSQDEITNIDHTDPRNQIDLAFFETLQALPLQELGVWHLTMAGFRALSEFLGKTSRLTVLDMSDSMVVEKESTVFRSPEHSKSHVQIQENLKKIRIINSQMLREGFLNNRTLRSLNLQSCQYMELEPGLKNHPTLCSIEVENYVVARNDESRRFWLTLLQKNKKIIKLNYGTRDSQVRATVLPEIENQILENQKKSLVKIIFSEIGISMSLSLQNLIFDYCTQALGDKKLKAEEVGRKSGDQFSNPVLFSQQSKRTIVISSVAQSELLAGLDDDNTIGSNGLPAGI